jgi:hypothetical protein
MGKELAGEYQDREGNFGHGCRKKDGYSVWNSKTQEQRRQE